MVLFKYGNCSSPQYIFPSPSIPSSLDNTTQHNKYKATHSENDSGVTLMEEQKAIEEAASEGLKGMEHLVRLLSHQPSHLRTDVTVSSFKKLISLLNRTGHARFRRAPLHVPAQSQSLTLDFTKPNIFASKQETFSVSSNSTSFMSSALTADASVSIKNNRHDHVSGKLSCSTKCHCVKRRKNRMKKTVRVPAISSKNADIPPDEYSWRKYGQKPIKGSPYPRGYYKCSTVRGCPARKHVERASDDPTMLIVTYEAEHRHSMQDNISGGVGLVVFEST